MDDRHIIELFNLRDEKAISVTADKYGGYCFAIAVNILSNDEDAKECLNDTWLHAWQSIPPKQPNCLKVYLAKIVRNLSYDKFKERNRAKRGGGEIALVLEEISEFVSGVDSVESALAQEDFMRSVNRFLRSLSLRDCNIFIRRYFHADSTKSIAQRYHMTEGTVLKVLSRTRQKFKTYLELEGYTV